MKSLLALAIVLTATVAQAQERLTVYAVNYPLAYFAERIGGDAVEVVLPVPPDRDPAFWRPSIAEIGGFQSADLILLNGAGFADWTTRTTLPRGRLVDTSAGFAERYIQTETVTHSHGLEGEHSHTGVATFTWLDFGQAALQAEAVAAALSRREPERSAGFEAGLAALETDLAGLDAAAKALPDPDPATRIIGSHPRYQYFARAYGLTIDSVEWEVGEDPTPDGWAAFEATRGDAGHVVMLFEAEPTVEIRGRLEAEEVEVVVLPTIANVPPTGDFVSALAGGIAELSRALGD